MLPNTESEELVKTFTEKITNDKRKITKKRRENVEVNRINQV